ncbi:MAG: protein kinase domain-containing protein [Phycisphaerae bacterium]
MLQQLVEKATPFTIDALVGHGSQGFVCRATDANGRIVALKIIRAGALADERTQRRFLTEVSNHAALRHPHIVRVLESGQSEGVSWFTMDYIEGTPLSESQCRLMTLSMFKSICRALAYAHDAGVIHRDVKPSNIIVDQQGEPHLVDFGLSRRLDTADPLTSVGHSVGTVAYADPECILGRLATERSDVYGLGMILYEWATNGTYAYALDRSNPQLRRFIPYNRIVPPRVRAPEISVELETIIQKCLHPSPGKRYSSVKALLADVEAYESGQPIVATSSGLGFSSRLWMRRNKRMVVAMSALVVVSLVSGYIWSIPQQFALLSGIEQRANAQSSTNPILESESSNLASLHSAELDRWNRMTDGNAKRLKLPRMDSNWLDQFDGTLDQLVNTIQNNHFYMRIDRTEEFVLSEKPIGHESARVLALDLLSRAEQSREQQDFNGMVADLDAVRNLALDIGAGAHLTHKSHSIFLRNQIYSSLVQWFPNASYPNAVKRWMKNDPPVVGYTNALAYLRYGLVQFFERTFVEGTDGTNYIDVAKVRELLSDSVIIDSPIDDVSERDFVTLIFSIFEEYTAWDDVDSMEEIKRKLARRHSNWERNPAWSILSKVVPNVASGMPYLIETRKLKRQIEESLD